MNSKIQTLPSSDSPSTDAFEAIVELFFQLEGYITSSGKWYWVWGEGKRQRGYQDIDVLAIGDTETLIVSVTTCLDDKFRFDKTGKPRTDMLQKLKLFFQRSEEYLQSVPSYSWLVRPPRHVRYVVAYNDFRPNQVRKVENYLSTHAIETISAKIMLRKIHEYLDANQNLKTQNQVLRMFQVIKRQEKLGTMHTK